MQTLTLDSRSRESSKSHYIFKLNNGILGSCPSFLLGCKGKITTAWKRPNPFPRVRAPAAHARPHRAPSCAATALPPVPLSPLDAHPLSCRPQREVVSRRSVNPKARHVFTRTRGALCRCQTPHRAGLQRVVQQARAYEKTKRKEARKLRKKRFREGCVRFLVALPSEGLGERADVLLLMPLGRGAQLKSGS